MRIAISGTSATGKTTLTHALADHMGVRAISEYLGEPYKEGPTLTQLQEMERFRTILEAKHTRQLRCKEGFISDRSPVDLAYMWLIRALPLEHPGPTEVFFERCRALLSDYDFIVYTPLPEAQVGGANYFGPTDRFWEMWRHHLAQLGLAESWVPDQKLLKLPPSARSVDERVAWIMTECG